MISRRIKIKGVIVNDKKRQYIIAKSKEDQLWKLLDEHADDIARIGEVLSAEVSAKGIGDDQNITAFAMCALASILFIRKAEQSIEEEEGS